MKQKNPAKNQYPTLSTQLPTPKKDEILFFPLGGAEEIGMNLNVYGHDGDWIIVDFGIGFTGNYFPGVDIMFPDPAVIWQTQKLRAIVLTHAHEDHLGAIPYLFEKYQCPIYATPFTARLLQKKMAEENRQIQLPIHIIAQNGHFQLGAFDLQLVHITHSIPEPNALFIKTKAGNILHTGDWKLDPDPLIGKPTHLADYQQFGVDGVMAMICDSTNVFVPGTAKSEGEVQAHLKEVIHAQKGRILITCFASNVARIAAIGRAAKSAGRVICICGRAFERVIEAAKFTGYLQDFPPYITESEAKNMAPHKIVFLVTGSQGEPRAALAKIARGEHPIKLEAGDSAIFSARKIPGNEESVAYIQNKLAKAGVRVINDDDDIHASGHPCRDDLCQLYQLVKPDIAIPVHGEQLHLHEHIRLIQSLQIPNYLLPHNGAVIRLAQGEQPQILTTITPQLLSKDGRQLVSLEDDTFAQRRKMGREGIIFISVFSQSDPRGKYKAHIDVAITFYGLYIDDILYQQCIAEAIKMAQTHGNDNQNRQEKIAIAVRKLVRQTIDKNPPVVVHYQEI